MTSASSKTLRWIRQLQVPAAVDGARSPLPRLTVSPTERLLVALADGPRTVAQLAQQFGLAQPTVLEQVRRARRDGLIAEVEVPESERRFAGERYYAPAIPVIRQPDREILEAACRGVAEALAGALRVQQAEIVGAFVLTSLYRDGWQLPDLWPYLQETIYRLALACEPDLIPTDALGSDRPVWLEILPAESGNREEVSA